MNKPREIIVKTPENCPSPRHVTPQCCDRVKNTSAVFLYMEEGEKPKWVVRVYFTPYKCSDVQEAKFCPFCATPVPKIIPSGETRPICKDTGGGYCETCGERLRCCTCLPSEFAWKAKDPSPLLGLKN